MAKSQRSTSSRTRLRQASGTMLFGRTNYILMGVGILVVAVGYAIMRMENAVDGFLSLYLAPLMILAGYLEVIYAILWRPKNQGTSSAA